MAVLALCEGPHSRLALNLRRRSDHLSVQPPRPAEALVHRHHICSGRRAGRDQRTRSVQMPGSHTGGTHVLIQCCQCSLSAYSAQVGTCVASCAGC